MKYLFVFLVILGSLGCSKDEAKPKVTVQPPSKPQIGVWDIMTNSVEKKTYSTWTTFYSKEKTTFALQLSCHTKDKTMSAIVGSYVGDLNKNNPESDLLTEDEAYPLGFLQSAHFAKEHLSFNTMMDPLDKNAFRITFQDVLQKSDIKSKTPKEVQLLVKIDAEKNRQALFNQTLINSFPLTFELTNGVGTFHFLIELAPDAKSNLSACL